MQRGQPNRISGFLVQFPKMLLKMAPTLICIAHLHMEGGITNSRFVTPRNPPIGVKRNHSISEWGAGDGKEEEEDGVEEGRFSGRRGKGLELMRFNDSEMNLSKRIWKNRKRNRGKEGGTERRQGRKEESYLIVGNTMKTTNTALI